MINSAAIVRAKPAASKEARAKKRDVKKVQAAERKATKQVRPSPINARTPKPDEPVVNDNSPPTRDEMLQQAAAKGLKVDNRWSDSRLLKHIEDAQCLIPNANL